MEPNEDAPRPEILNQDPEQVIKQLAEAVRLADLPKLRLWAQSAIDRDRLPTDEFIGGLTEVQQLDIYRGCLLVHVLSHGSQIPRQFQLEAVLAGLGGFDGIVSSATGSGKTLIMILLLLLRPNEMAMLIVPLKRLQQSQVCMLYIHFTFCLVESHWEA